MFKVNNWNVSNIEYLTPQPGTAPVAGQDYVIFEVPDLATAPYSFLQSDMGAVADSATGNSLEAVAIFDDHGNGSYFTLKIEDGVHKAGINVYQGKVTTLDSAYTTLVENEDNNTHRYTLTLQNGLLNVFFDKTLIISYTVTQNATTTRLGVGFFEAQQGAATLKLRYLKQAKGIYNYIKADDVDFELQIDVADTFDTPNLKTYTKASFVNIPNPLHNWDPVSLICGTYREDAYDFIGLVQAATVHLPPRQDGETYTFYYRVRFFNDRYVSDWSYLYLEKREKPIAISPLDPTDKKKIGYIVNDINDAYLVFNPSEDNVGIQLPETPTTNGLTLTIYNASKYNLQVFTHDLYNPFVLEGRSVSEISYDATTDKWNLAIRFKRSKFNLPQNIQNIVFDAVFNYHIPAYDYVYTKAFESGNVADYVHAVAESLDFSFEQQIDLKRNLDSFSADRDLFNERWSNIFDLDKSLFKNSAEMRDAFLCISEHLKSEMIKRAVSDLVFELTGAKPDIYEYKDLNFNILWDSETRRLLPSSQKYYLYDDEHPSFYQNPFVLYGGSAKAFTWQINVYDPYNLEYNQNLITQVLDFFKPAHTYVIVNFYNHEGVRYSKRYFYGIDNYLESLYNL